MTKVYPCRQVECNKSSHKNKIDHKIKWVNNDNGETQKEGENMTYNDSKTEIETPECDFRIHEHSRIDEEHEQNKEDTEIEKEKKYKTRK